MTRPPAGKGERRTEEERYAGASSSKEEEKKAEKIQRNCPLPSERLGVRAQADGVEAAVSREGSVEVGRGRDS